MNWRSAVSRCTEANDAFVLVTVLAVRGSAPRGVQSKMVITQTRQFDSIGGGNLEYAATLRARELLLMHEAVVEQQTFTLGEDLTQCCGGAVTLLLESFPACTFQVVLCGAGHVGRALVQILSELPCRVSWLDERTDLLDEAFTNASCPDNIEKVSFTNPYDAVDRRPANSYFLVMTHSHESDFAFCEAILGRPDIAFCGLIGSRSKANSFRGRLRRKGFTEEELARLVSPLGLDLGPGKSPMEVAVSIAAQLLRNYYRKVEQDDAHAVCGGQLELVRGER